LEIFTISLLHILKRFLKDNNMSDYNVLEDTIFLSDTTYKHSVKQIDEHLVVQDTIIVTQKQEITKEYSQNELRPYFEFLVVILVVISFVNHYLKKKKNGS